MKRFFFVENFKNNSLLPPAVERKDIKPVGMHRGTFCGVLEAEGEIASLMESLSKDTKSGITEVGEAELAKYFPKARAVEQTSGPRFIGKFYLVENCNRPGLKLPAKIEPVGMHRGTFCGVVAVEDVKAIEAMAEMAADDKIAVQEITAAEYARYKGVPAPVISAEPEQKEPEKIVSADEAIQTATVAEAPDLEPPAEAPVEAPMEAKSKKKR